MTEHNLRVGPDESGHVEVTSGDGTTPQTAVNIPAEALMRVDRIEWEYDSSATAASQFTVYDEPDGTSSGDTSDDRARAVNLSSGGDSGTIEGSGRDFEQGVLIEADGNQDASIYVTVYGEKLTDLADMVGR